MDARQRRPLEGNCTQSNPIRSAQSIGSLIITGPLAAGPNASAVIDNRWRNELQLSAVHHHSHRRWETRMDVASLSQNPPRQLRRRLKRVAARHWHPRRVWSRHSAYTKDHLAKGEKR